MEGVLIEIGIFLIIAIVATGATVSYTLLN